MAYPDKPVISTSYTAKEEAAADGSLPGQELDVDFAALAASLESLNDFVRGVTRSDGGLANGIVRRESLGADVLIGFDAPTTWATGVGYTLSNTVFNGAAFYICVIAHTSGSDFATDLAAGRWSLLFDLSGTGTLVAQNNLSDLDSAAVALQNLELTATAAELNTLDGISGDVQTQLDALTSSVGGKQASATILTLLSALSLSANKGWYATGAGSLSLYDLTAAGRALAGAADAAAQRGALGLGSLATQNFSDIQGSVDARVDAKALGVGQTWQDVSGSRTFSTSYQNTTGRPIEVSINCRTSNTDFREIQVSPDNATWVQVGLSGRLISGASYPQNVEFTVPDGWYYRIDGSVTSVFWAELR